MLYRHSEVFRSLMMVADLCVIAVAWLGAYAVRFYTGIPAPLGIPPVDNYLAALGVILPLWWLLLRRRGLYEPRRMGSLVDETVDVLRAALSAVVILLALSFFVRSFSFSRGVVLLFGLAAPALIVGLRLGVRVSLRHARRLGYNRRFVLVVGGGRLAEEIIARIHDHPQTGMHVEGVLAEGLPGRLIRGVPVIGQYSDLKQALGRLERIDQVIIALSRDEGAQLDKILSDLDDEVASVKLAPDLLHILTLHSSVESFDGLPIIGLRESPLVGWASVQKRALDLVASSVLLLALSPVFAAIAVGVRLSSGRPIFYRQQRMGLDGYTFSMVKFRSMRRNAEQVDGAVWTTPDDPRRTRFGAWLRRFSLDELPQLWNVLVGDMSLVGPRPERPIFIEEFRRAIPGYMLRHKVKSGLTGWAQVHGWRGDTSLHERIEHDLYYMQNWSPGLDIQILLMTIWSAVFSRNAY